MSARIFLDSNILLYLFDNVAIAKRRRAEELLEEAFHSGQTMISYQVVQEVLNVMTRKLRMPSSDILDFLNDILYPLLQIYPSLSLYQQSLHTQTKYHYSFYDSLILASALAGSCTILYSEDLQHMHKIADLTIINPFELR